MSAYRVLVVDDNHEVRRMVTSSIKTLGEEVDVMDVPSAEEALIIITSLPLDLVVLDYRLPGMSGLEMVARLRKRKPDIKIILVTGIEDTHTRELVSRAEVAAYFFKPLDIGTFLDAVRRCLGISNGETASPTGDAVPASSAEAVVTSRSPQAAESGSYSAGGAQPAASGGKTDRRGYQPTLEERLTALKGQVRASSVVLVQADGQIMERIGDTADFMADTQVVPAFMGAHSAILKVQEALGLGSAESLLAFSGARKRIYLAPVNVSCALMVAIPGLFEPEKLGLLDRALHLAVMDLQTILDTMREASQPPASAETGDMSLPAEVTVDAETMARIEAIFSQAAKTTGKDDVDGFWDQLQADGSLDGEAGGDVLSYDQARNRGLTPGEQQGS